MTWPPLFSALERIWLKVNDPQASTLPTFFTMDERSQNGVKNMIQLFARVFSQEAQNEIS